MKYSDKCERLSHSEHQARAMLLGLMYDWRDGTYCAEGHLGGPSADTMLDCQTLEPIKEGSVEYHLRRSQGYMGDPNWNKPTEPTPWAKLG